MSAVIIGGNERMERQYKELCAKYQYKAKVYTKTVRGLRDIGDPDLIVLFTNTVSHKMVQNALDQAKKKSARVVRCHSSSMNALREILEGA